ncbi:glutamyl-tRNA reductase [Flavihumibacter petaseus]|uniref:Glutamyl-tRNA reductase n=1 Tax=Flavihumibacter petaseus NBRC 106054 TaxID=1220578 RepID=A0A0E9MW14_9BACT|nr:glutamyl-tRNA reductase [Flavihumibacter petaseus]GAO41784.1 glutamyl-tRNA reductase [Flavihumibacter petaseus NBRC 106054]
MGDYPKDLQHFFMAGISYKKSDSALRSRFAVSTEQYFRILSLAPAYQVAEVFVLSTCNRTEIYGIARDIEPLIQLLCEATGESASLFQSIAYTGRGKEATQHLFEVAAGLDSQILGDYEIVGQIKTAVKQSKDAGRIGPFLERLYNQVLQASKMIKNQTALSSGTVSVSFAAIQYLKDQVTDIASKHILLVGTGKIGRNTGKNLVDYLGCKQITLINRTAEKALTLARELGISARPAEDLDAVLQEADVIIVAANAQAPIVTPQQLPAGKQQWLIDLSIPNNVHPDTGLMPGKQLLNVDELSRMKDETLQKRLAEVPKALEIIAGLTAEFLEWCRMRKQLIVLGHVKRKLEEYNSTSTFVASDEAAYRIQQVLNNMAVKMRQQNQRGCQYLEAINDFIGYGVN